MEISVLAGVAGAVRAVHVLPADLVGPGSPPVEIEVTR